MGDVADELAPHGLNLLELLAIWLKRVASRPISSVPRTGTRSE
jgi:hypothetical protein